MPTAAPAAYPLAPPTISGNTITVDQALDQPTRITRMIMDLTQQRFFVDRVFPNAGGVTGGAVVYDQATTNELYTTRDVEQVAPGAEFPVLTSDRLAPQVAPVKKYGGKVFITDEARDRNDATVFANQIRKVANTMVRKINQIGVDTLEAAITGTGGATTITGHNWGTVVTAGSSATSAQSWPFADFLAAQLAADVQELGVEIDTWVMNPAQYNALVLVYGVNLPQVLREANVSIFRTNRVAAGSAYAMAAGQVGGMRVEKPLSTETWREAITQRTWVQSDVRPVFYVTNPYSVFKLTGLAG